MVWILHNFVVVAILCFWIIFFTSLDGCSNKITDFIERHFTQEFLLGYILFSILVPFVIGNLIYLFGGLTPYIIFMGLFLALNVMVFGSYFLGIFLRSKIGN